MQAKPISTTGIRPADCPTPDGSSQDIEDFIYLISHDVRSSVRALLELPQWIVEDLEQEGFEIKGQVASSIDLLNRHTGRLDRMLVDLLAFSRIGRMQKVINIDLEAAVNDVIDELDLPSGFIVQKRLGMAHFRSGERDILTMISALITNAVKHHDKAAGEIVVSSKAIQGGVCISVSDDGPGIPAEHAERVFGAMTTLRPRDEVEGSGMGLAIVRKIARFYGGEAILASSSDGTGSRIEVTLRDAPDSIELFGKGSQLSAARTLL